MSMYKNAHFASNCRTSHKYIPNAQSKDIECSLPVESPLEMTKLMK